MFESQCANALDATKSWDIICNVFRNVKPKQWQVYVFKSLRNTFLITASINAITEPMKMKGWIILLVVFFHIGDELQH